MQIMGSLSTIKIRAELNKDRATSALTHESATNNHKNIHSQKKNFKSHSFALLISRYILRLGQRGRCCFCTAYLNRKMYLEIRNADEGALIAVAVSY